MPASSLRERLSGALIEFAWDEWAQMGVLATPQRESRWAQDPEALALLTFEAGRDEPRLFEEVLGWLLRNEPLVSARRLRGLCEDRDDEALAAAALDWVARRRRPHGRPAPRADLAESPRPLFRGSMTPVRDPDPSFLAYGWLRPSTGPSGKAQEPDLTAPINFALRLRQLLGVSARAEAVRYLLTADVPRASVAAVAASSGYTKRNIAEALSSLHDAGVVSLVAVGTDQRYGIDRSRWAHLLGLDVRDLPAHVDWPQLLGVLREILRWLDRPELADKSEYLRASEAGRLLERIRPRLAHAGVVTSAWRGADHAWDDLAETVEGALLGLGPPVARGRRPSSFEVYMDSAGAWRWRVSAANGQVVAASAESYVSAANARAAAGRVKENAGSYTFGSDPDEAGNFRWELRARNGQAVAVSAEAFASAAAAERAVRAAQEFLSGADGL